MVVFLLEFGRLAALAPHAIFKGDAGQVAFEVVDPAVIDAGDLAAVALVGQAQQGAAVGGAVDKAIDPAARPARVDDRGLADSRGDPVAPLLDLAREAQIAPRRPL